MVFIFLTTFPGEAAGWLSSGVTLQGVVDPFVRGWLGL